MTTATTAMTAMIPVSSVAKFLPKNAPLSTFRVMTGSKLGMASSGAKRNKSDPPIFAFSCVFRAGRQNSLTDHDSILFDVDVPNKKMGVGTVNMHWYQVTITITITITIIITMTIQF